jgi:hypothetical protein
MRKLGTRHEAASHVAGGVTCGRGRALDPQPLVLR